MNKNNLRIGDIIRIDSIKGQVINVIEDEDVKREIKELQDKIVKNVYALMDNGYCYDIKKDVDLIHRIDKNK